MGREYLYKVGEFVGEGTLRIVEQTRVKNGNGTRKGYIVKSLAYPDSKNDYEMSESSLKDGHKCAYISNQRICEENSLYSFEEIRVNIVDVKQAKTISPNYSKEILFKCAGVDCKTTKKMSPHRLGQKRWYCLSCSNSRSFGEISFNKYQEYFKLGFESEKILAGLPNRRVDFINFENGMWVEIQGKQHSTPNTRGYESAQEQDLEKRAFAKKNTQYNLIEIDMCISSWEYFKTQINNCEYLPNINDEDEKAILKMMENNIGYDVALIKSMYLNDMASVYVIANELGMKRHTVESILTRNGVELRGPTLRRVKCLNNDMVFDSIKDAKDWGIQASKISAVCNGERKTAGKHPVTGEKLTWEYV